MESIKNYDVYINGMRKSLKDKLFFMNMTEAVDTLIDFGCADGELLKEVHQKFPQYRLIGIDSDRVMLERATNKVSNLLIIKQRGLPKLSIELAQNAILNMSSIINEIYTYSNKYEISDFWHNVFNTGYKYISIRDLMMGKKSYRFAQQLEIEAIKQKIDKIQLEDFIKQWGDIKTESSLIHLLLKYRYKENWEREVKENYFPITVEEFLSIIPTNQYKIIYFDHYMLPFNKEQIWKDFGIKLKDNTHMKILLERI